MYDTESPDWAGQGCPVGCLLLMVGWMPFVGLGYLAYRWFA